MGACGGGGVGGRPDPPDGRNSDRDCKSGFQFCTPRFLLENQALVGFSKGNGAYGGHEGDPTENGCFTEGLHKE